jgi:Putative phage serine protease XkdF
MEKKLELYELKINDSEELGVDIMSLVDRPAIEKNYVMFNENKTMWTANNERQIVSGPAMIPDKIIYRNDENGEYNTVIRKDVIEKVVLKFMQNGNQSNVNVMHEKNVKDCFIFESFISDEFRGIMPMKGFEELPNGTWFISMKINNIDVWQSVKDGTFKGFSIEGMFTHDPVKMSVEDALIAIAEIVKDIK